MAYQDTHHIAFGDSFKSVGDHVLRILGAVGDWLISISEGNRRVKLVESLQAKSDAELEKLGLRREEIVRHVFRDVYFS